MSPKDVEPTPRASVVRIDLDHALQVARRLFQLAAGPSQPQPGLLACGFDGDGSPKQLVARRPVASPSCFLAATEQVIQVEWADDGAFGLGWRKINPGRRARLTWGLLLVDQANFVRY